MFEDIIKERRERDIESIKKIRQFCDDAIKNEESWSVFKHNIRVLVRKENRRLKNLLNQERLP